jgi:site-specific DNA-cytosine methylase
MGFADKEIDNLIGHFSKSTLYRFAGNSVVVDCFVEITKEIIKDMEGKNVTLGNFL